jgi:hypothetical protein
MWNTREPQGWEVPPREFVWKDIEYIGTIGRCYNERTHPRARTEDKLGRSDRDLEGDSGESLVLGRGDGMDERCDGMDGEEESLGIAGGRLRFAQAPRDFHRGEGIAKNARGRLRFAQAPRDFSEGVAGPHGNA